MNSSKMPVASAKVSTPNVRDAERTQQSILDVATAEFAERGLAGARIDEIAEKTSTSKRMIYYYYGSKDELYRAVLERAYLHIRDREASEKFETLPAADALAALVQHTFDYHAAHPEFVRLVMSENIQQGAHIGHVAGIKERNQGIIAQLRAILDKGAAEGRFRQGISPTDLHMTISALCFYNVSNRYTFAHNFSVDMGDAGVAARRKAQIVDIILRWVKE